jgi:DNA-binding MarR family transcriptional regulator
MRPSSKKIEAWRLMLEAHQRLTTQMDVELREQHGLRLDWYDVLYQLSVAGGRLRMHELADATLFSRTDCTRIVDRMERAGLVQRERASEDGRGVYAAMTDEGRALLREAAVTHLGDIQRLFGAQVTSEEATVMARALERTLEAAGEWR